MREFLSGATRDEDTTKLDFEGFLSPLVLRRFAEYMHEHRVQADGTLRASDNWQRGIPKLAYMQSLFRHFMDVWTLWRGDKVLAPVGKAWEDALCAMLFNVQGLLHESLLSQGTVRSEIYYPGSIRNQDGLGRIRDLEGKLLSPEEMEARAKDASDASFGPWLGYNKRRI